MISALQEVQPIVYFKALMNGIIKPLSNGTRVKCPTSFCLKQNLQARYVQNNKLQSCDTQYFHM